MSGFPITGVPGVPGGVATLSSTGSVLSAIPSGSTGVGVGSLAGPDTSGTATAVGYHALAAETTPGAGYGDTAMGYNAGAANTIGGITAFGYSALKVSNALVWGGAGVDEGSNSAFGMNALQQNTTGYMNTAVGGAAMAGNLTGQQNVAIGNMALETNTTGYGSVAIGVNAMTYFNAGNSSVAIGFSALEGNVNQTLNTGYGNIAIGSQAGMAMQSGTANCLIGNQAGWTITSGSANIMIGGNTGVNTVTGSYNTLICNSAKTATGVDASNCVAIGLNTICSYSGSVAIGCDTTNAGAVTPASTANAIMLGTALHTVYRYATNTSLGATASTPTIANTATGVQVNATKDVMLYLTCSLAGTGFTLKIGPTSTPAYTIVSNVAVTIGDCFAVRVPGGWYVSWQATTATFANQQAVTC